MTPFRIAGLVALVYLIPSLIYIFISSQLASNIAADPEQMATIEIVKGVLFVTGSATLIFGVCFKVLSVTDRRRRENQVMREALLDAERRAMTGVLSASIAHDAHNELAVLKSNNQFLQRRDDLDEMTCDVVVDQQVAIERLIELMKRLVDAGERHAGTSAHTLDIVEIAAGVIDSLRRHSRLDGCRIRLKTITDKAEIKAYSPLIHQILINLIFNAADAVEDVDEGGQIEVRIDTSNSAIVVEVHDNGPGIPESQRQKIFEAFYTTKESGSGLGLLSVHACALTHGGYAEAVDSPLGGACIRVVLEQACSEFYDAIDIPLLHQDAYSDASSKRLSAAVD